MLILCRRLENLESEMVYITRGKCSIYRASRVRVFFEKSFRVPKVVPKVGGESYAKSEQWELYL